MSSLFSSFMKQRETDRRTRFKKALMHFEGRIGGRLFGPLPKDRRREFFCLDRHTWVWHEEWKDEYGKLQAVTTRYDVRPQGVYKSQGHMQYQPLSREEARNFRKAVQLYGQRMAEEYGRMLGQPV